MRHTIKTALAIAVVSGMMAGCGINPFGAGSLGGLNIFASIAKAMQKPSAIDKQDGSKDGSKAVVGAAQGQMKRLAKRAADPGVIARGITPNADGSYTYWEHVVNKPSEEDPQKLMTGLGEVAFTYSGATAPDTLTVDTALITGIKSFHFAGTQNKSWSLEIDTMDILVTFIDPSKTSLLPGFTRVWGKNISAVDALGKGDTACFTLQPLAQQGDSIQSGTGDFLDAHTGRDNGGEQYPFNFTVQINHHLTYSDYKDNDGYVEFKLPWGKSGVDSLYFWIHFFPRNYQQGYYREGEIRKNDANGPVRVKFTNNEKTGVGTVVYYDDNGKEIPQ